MPIASNPRGETVKTFESLSETQIDEKLQRAAETFRSYRHTALAERKAMMLRAAGILEAEKQDFARLMTTEMGKPILSAVGEAEKCALVCRYYAEHARAHLTDLLVETNATKSYVKFQPLGPVLAVMPWNFPFWQVFRFAAPALMAGNVGLLKHASNVPQCALAIVDIFRRAGFPEGAFQTLLVGSDVVQRILEDRRVAAATLTGSEPAGRSVASIAGKQIKKTVLELGGSDPFIVMPSANFDEAVTTAVKARTINNGQSCIAAKRFIVAAEIYDEFERRFVATMKALSVGDPLDEATDIGPLATEQILQDVTSRLRRRSPRARDLDRRQAVDRPAISTSQPSSPAFPPTHQRSAKKCSVPWPCSSASKILMRQSNWQTLPPLVSVRRPGPTIQGNKNDSSMNLKRAQFSSTAWSPPTRGCRLAESKTLATVAN